MVPIKQSTLSRASVSSKDLVSRLVHQLLGITSDVFRKEFVLEMFSLLHKQAANT